VAAGVCCIKLRLRNIHGLLIVFHLLRRDGESGQGFGARQIALVLIHSTWCRVEPLCASTARRSGMRYQHTLLAAHPNPSLLSRLEDLAASRPPTDKLNLDHAMAVHSLLASAALVHARNLARRRRKPAPAPKLTAG
jgi:hypothetical protein